MPGIDGYQVASEVRKFCKEAAVSEPYIVGLSGDNTGEVKERAKESGMIELLVKPISKESLEKITAKYIKK